MSDDAGSLIHCLDRGHHRWRRVHGVAREPRIRLHDRRRGLPPHRNNLRFGHEYDAQEPNNLLAFIQQISMRTLGLLLAAVRNH